MKPTTVDQMAAARRLSIAADVTRFRDPDHVVSRRTIEWPHHAASVRFRLDEEGGKLERGGRQLDVAWIDAESGQRREATVSVDKGGYVEGLDSGSTIASVWKAIGNAHEFENVNWQIAEAEFGGKHEAAEALGVLAREAAGDLERNYGRNVNGISPRGREFTVSGSEVEQNLSVHHETSHVAAIYKARAGEHTGEWRVALHHPTGSTDYRTIKSVEEGVRRAAAHVDDYAARRRRINAQYAAARERAGSAHETVVEVPQGYQRIGASRNLQGAGR